MSSRAGAKKIILTLEGNIGAGKSTFLRILQEHVPLIDVVFEPTNKWQSSCDEENLLKLFYQDNKRWAYTFQSYAFISRIQQQEESLARNPHLPVQVLERSVYCDRYCFAYNLYEMGMMTPLEWHMYTEWFSWLVEAYTTKPSGFIYLKTTPQTCLDRIQKRARSEESAIPLSYLESIHEKHERWLVHSRNSSTITAHIPVLELACDEDFEHNSERLRKHLEQVQRFIERLSQNTPSSGISEQSLFLEPSVSL